MTSDGSHAPLAAVVTYLDLSSPEQRVVESRSRLHRLLVAKLDVREPEPK